MSDESEEPEDKAAELKPKVKAEDNPWYLLATLYGEPEPSDDELRAKNRVAWNRYFAGNLNEARRAQLLEKKRHSAEELTPYLPEELHEIEEAFAKRYKGSAKGPALPKSDAEIDFSNVAFEQHASFTQYLFSRSSSFEGATFSTKAYFDGAAFSGEAAFDGAAFSDSAFFGRAAFSSSASFNGAAFRFAYFRDATFTGLAFFLGATFSPEACFTAFSSIDYFGGPDFPSSAYFGGATFSTKAYFDGAAFSGEAAFDGAAFSGEADFDGVTFSGQADFRKATFRATSRFVNVEMKWVTSFEGAIFKTEPPKFFGAKLHEGTIWRGITWPPKPKDKETAGSFVDAYERLKVEMDRLKKHEDELDFFALELRSRRVLLGPLRGLPIALYGLLSDYGRSYARPLAWLFVIAVACAPVFWHFGAKAPIDSVGLSHANLLSVFGFRKDFNLPIDSLPVALKILAATQTIVGGALLFLFGLGIRNKFRMK